MKIKVKCPKCKMAYEGKLPKYARDTLYIVNSDGSTIISATFTAECINCKHNVTKEDIELIKEP